MESLENANLTHDKCLVVNWHKRNQYNTNCEIFWSFRLDSLLRYYQFHLTGVGVGGKSGRFFSSNSSSSWIYKWTIESEVFESCQVMVPFKAGYNKKEFMVPQSYKALCLISQHWYLHTTLKVPSSFLGTTVVQMQCLENIWIIQGSPLWTVFLVWPLQSTHFVAYSSTHTLI